MIENPGPINREGLIVVEGDDEFNLIQALLGKMDSRDRCEIRCAGGKDAFRQKFDTLIKTTGFDKVKAIGFIRDAEKQPARSAFESIKSILNNHGLITPNNPGEIAKGNPSVGIFINPDNEGEGCLEDLCLAAVSSNPAMACVNEFITCVSKLNQAPKNISKCRAFAFLAAMPDETPSVGIAAIKGYWDFDSGAFAQLKDFISKILVSC